MSRSDIGAIATYIAGGGLAGAFLFIGTVWPKYQTVANGAAVALVAIAGLVRTIANPTPTNTAVVFDRTTGSTVSIKTAAAPSNTPAPPPTYAPAPAAPEAKAPPAP